MASSEVVSTNPDLPRESSSSSSSSSSISPLSSLLSDLHHPMDDILNSISPTAAKPLVDEVWKDIVVGNNAVAAADHAITLEDFLLTKSRDDDDDRVGGGEGGEGVIPPSPPPPPPPLPLSLPAPVSASSSSIAFSLPLPAEGSSSSVEPFGANGSVPSNSGHKGKRRAVEEPVDKATLQKQRRMIKNRESAARSRERKQAYTSELEYLVHQLEQENARLLNEEAEMRRQRKKQLFECIIPIEVMPKPKKKLRRVNSAQSL